MVIHMCKYNDFIIIHIVCPTDRHMVWSSAEVIPWMHQHMTKQCVFFSDLWNRVYKNLWHFLRVLLPFIFNTHIPQFCFSSLIHCVASASPMPLSSSESATNSNVFRVTEIRVPEDQPAPVTPIYIATSRRTSFLPPSCRIAGRDIHARHREAKAMELYDTLGEPNVRKVFLASDLLAVWARFACINISRNLLDHQAASRKQSFVA